MKCAEHGNFVQANVFLNFVMQQNKTAFSGLVPKSTGKMAQNRKDLGQKHDHGRYVPATIFMLVQITCYTYYLLLDYITVKFKKTF